MARGSQVALRELGEQLETAGPEVWLGFARIVLQRGYAPLAAAILARSLATHPLSVPLRHWHANAAWQAGDAGTAEAGLRQLLAETTNADAAMLLAQLLRGQGRLNGAAAVLADNAAAIGDTPTVLGWAQFMRECQRQDLALDWCERELDRGHDDPRLYFLAGNLAQELGQFDLARKHYLDALAHGIDQNRWFVLGSLASVGRYRDRAHPDFALFEQAIRNPALSPRARAAVLFAQGKACDDIGDHASAAAAWRKANALMRPLTPWLRSQWQHFVASRVAARPLPVHRGKTDCMPVFVVGLPRSGTTLVAELLGRHPDVCNRGELPLMGYLAERLATLNDAQQAAGIGDAAAIYLAHLQRDDARASAYIDKNPLNFRYLDAIAALLPGARVIYCRRQLRDTALSIWSQLFGNDEYGFANDFHDIAALASGCDTLMAHWQRSLPLSIVTLDYEQVTADPRGTVARLTAQLGLAPFDPSQVGQGAPSVITSASQWQARQPIHRRSVERWRAYADDLPELTALFAQ
ncbi:MAG TPA: sulfotransferase [Rhodanobacter sp.]|nr:sulfotransferase [Rhodanobacter sp.]